MTKTLPFASDEYKTNINYHLLMEKELDTIKQSGKKATLLLHSCCAPCSSHVLTVLQRYYDITIFFYNPNIYPEEEFALRKAELLKLIDILNKETLEKEKTNAFEDKVFHETPINFAIVPYNPKEFYDVIGGYEKALEGSPRCYLCYTLRLEKTAKYAFENGFDYFCTTLTVSPYKNAFWLNEAGKLISKQYNIKFLQSDFKKNDGYKHSLELSEKYGLYRQHYCGCEFSLQAALNKKSAQEKSIK